MGAMSKYIGGALATKKIINAYSVAGWLAQAVSAIDYGAKVVSSGALTANTLSTVFSKTDGPCEFHALYFTTVDATARTMRVKITIDGVVVFDYTSGSISSSGYGMVAAGFVSSIVNVFHGSIRSSSSLIIEIASDRTETDKFQMGYIAQELN